MRTPIILVRTGIAFSAPKIVRGRFAELLLEHGDERARARVTSRARGGRHLLAGRKRLECEKKPQLLAPLRKRHLRFRDEKSLRRALACTCCPAELLQSFLLARIDENMFCDAHRARVTRLREVQRCGTSRM